MPDHPATAIAALTVDCGDASQMVQFYRRAFGGEPDPAGQPFCIFERPRA